MRILIDTNILIPLEDSSKILDESLSEFYKLAQEYNHQLLIHPGSIEDIERDTDENRRNITLSRAQKYILLENPPICDSESGFEVEEANPNDKIDNQLLCSVYKNAVNILVTEDIKIHSKAKNLEVPERVHYIQQATELLKNLHTKEVIQLPNVKEVFAHQLNLSGKFFDSLREDYEGFDDWFKAVSAGGRKAWIYQSKEDLLKALCIFKDEDSPIITKENKAIPGKVLKLCTFKVDESYRGKKIGELFLKAAFLYATKNKCEYLYITLKRESHKYLEELLKNFGFEKYGKYRTNVEWVYVKKHPQEPPKEKISPVLYNIKYFPHFIGNNSVQKFIVPIRPEFHEILFPEIQKQMKIFGASDVENAIKLAYLCHAPVGRIHKGDLLLFYRSRDEKAITSLGVVEEYVEMNNPDQIAQLVSKRTVYSYSQIEDISKRKTKVILFRLALHFQKFIPYEWLLNNNIVTSPIQTIRLIKNESFSEIINKFQIQNCLSIN